MEEEGFGIHKIQLFFKNMSMSLNLQKEVKDADIASADQKELPSASDAHTCKAPNVKYAPEEIRSEQDRNGDDDLYSSSYFYDEISEDLKDQKAANMLQQNHIHSSMAASLRSMA